MINIITTNRQKRLKLIQCSDRVCRISLYVFIYLSFVCTDNYKVYASTEPNIRFEQPIVDGEVFDESLTAGIIDSQGFLWLATDDGLVRYDGYSIKRFRHDPDNPNSISGNQTLSVLEDQNGYIWIGTMSAGLNRFDPKSEIFTSFLPEKLNNAKIWHLFEDSFGSLWVSTARNGLLELEPDSREYVQYLTDKNDIDSITSSYVYQVLEDINTKGNLWVATNNGLDYFDRQTKIFSHYKHDENEPTSLGHRYVYDLSYDSNGKLWIATRSGLNEFIPESNSFNRYYPNNLNSTQRDDDNLISDILEDRDGRFWVGTGGGLKLFDRENEVFSNYYHQPYNPHSLSGDYIYINGLFEDRSGSLWIITSAGLNKLNLSATRIRNLQHEKSNSDSLNGNKITSVYEDDKEQLWIGTEKSGLELFDPVSQQFIHFSHDPKDSTSLSSNHILSILVDSNETLWIGTDKGLNRRDKGKTNFQHYRFHSEKRSFHSDRITALLEDYQGRVWIGTSKGLRLYDEPSGEFLLKLPEDIMAGSHQHAGVQALYEDSSHRLWLATKSGLKVFNPDTNEFINYTISNRDSNFSSVEIFQSINGYLWLSNLDGLHRLEIESKTVKHYRKKDGIASNSIHGILEDKDNNLWLSTDKGITRFDQTEETFKNYYSEDGLQDSGYNLNSFLIRKNGEIVAGGSDGIDSFHPEDFQEDSYSYSPTVSLTDFLLFNSSVPIASGIVNENKFSLKHSINNSRMIELSHRESMFAFEFSALDFQMPNKSEYAYHLQAVNGLNIEQDWIYTAANKRTATYTNVPAGEYLFKVKASNKDGVWSENETSLVINILPPPWLTWWAKMLYVLSATALLFIFYFFRTTSLRRRALLLEATVTRRTKELSTEKQKVEQLLSRKNEEFANASHEIRTPLTLILGPLKQLLKTAHSNENVRRLNTIQKNGYRLLRLVDQLLNLETSRINSISPKYPQCFASTINNLVEAFHDHARENKIELVMGKVEHVSFDFTPDAFEKVFLNLLSNAFKFTDSDGVIFIQSTRTLNNELNILIEDSGIGIPADNTELVFERYSRIIDEHSERVSGAGIGLSLVKEIVESHNGRVELKSELGIGTSINVYLPIINEVDKSEVKQKNTSEDIIALELMNLIKHSSPLTIAIEGKNDCLTGNKPHILIIEDNQDMRDYIVENIQSDYHVTMACNGQEGISIATSEIPDLVICDIMMPKMNGYEVTAQLRNNQLTNHIPVILLTARSDQESRLKGWYEKADEYLTKPFDVEELKVRMNNLLELRNILKKSFAERAFKLINSSAKLLTQTSQDANTEAEKQQELFVEKINNTLELLYAEPSTTISTISTRLAMSDRQLFRKTKSILDMSPAEYLRRFRLEKSKILLAQGKSVTFTALEVGFSTQSSFTKCFRAQFGFPPSELKKKHREHCFTD